MKGLYRQVYFYTLGILIVSLVLATFTTGLLFNRREQGLFRQMVRSQILLIKHETHKVQRRNPELLPERLAELSEQLSWNMAYWYDGRLIYSSVEKPPRFDTLKKQRQLPEELLLLSSWTERRPQLALQVSPRSPRAILWLEPRWAAVGKGLLRGPLIGVMLLLLFLGLLLIPFTRFLLRPYQDLQDSIERLSHGNFLEAIPPDKHRSFKPLILAFNHMQQQIKAMMQQKERLVADVSHELRSPLTRLRLALEILAPRLPESESEGLMKQAIGEIEELDHIIQDVLEVSRLQLKGLKISPESLNLTLFLFELLEDYELSFEEQDLSLQVDIPDESVWLTADPRLLKRLFNNLLSNAVKYAPGPGALYLRLTETETEVVILLQDSGPGIPAEHLKKVFTPFYRIEDSRARDKGGVGLGLAIAYEIVKAHEGTLHIENRPEPESGLRLWIRFPRQIGQKEI